MSFIGSKPFIDRCLAALSSDEQIRLLAVIDTPVSYPIGPFNLFHTEFGFNQLQTILPDYHKFIYVTLCFDRIIGTLEDGYLIRLGETEYGFLIFNKHVKNMSTVRLTQEMGADISYDVLQEQLTTEEFRRVLGDLNDTSSVLENKVTVHNLPDGDWADEVLPSEIIDTFKEGDVLISPGNKYGIVVSNKNNYCLIYEIDSVYIRTYIYHKINGEWTYEGGGSSSLVEPIDSDTNALGGIVFYGGDEYIIPNAGKELRFRMEFRYLNIEKSSGAQDWFTVSSFIIHSRWPFSRTGDFFGRIADVFLNNPAQFVYVSVFHTALVNGERQFIDNDMYEITVKTESENIKFFNFNNLRTGQTFKIGYPGDGDLLDGITLVQVDLEDGGYDLFEL